eukprot:124422-Rhodomonas_salina.3
MHGATANHMVVPIGGSETSSVFEKPAPDVNQLPHSFSFSKRTQTVARRSQDRVLLPKIMG